MESTLGSNNPRLVQGTASSISSMRQTLPSGFEPQTSMVPFLPPGTNVQYPMHPGYPLYLAPVWPTGQIQPGNEGPIQTSPPSSEDGDVRPASDSSTRSPLSSGSAQRTLFIAGLPADVKEREIFNLLRFQPGFVDCSLTPSTNGKQAVAFASWRDHESASRCRDLLQGLRFDPFGPVSFLRVQFARAESKTRRTPVEASAAGPTSSWPPSSLSVGSTTLSPSESSSYGYFQPSPSSIADSSAPLSRQSSGSPVGVVVGGQAATSSSSDLGSGSTMPSQHHRASPTPVNITPNPAAQEARSVGGRSGAGRPNRDASATTSSGASPLKRLAGERAGASSAIANEPQASTSSSNPAATSSAQTGASSSMSSSSGSGLSSSFHHQAPPSSSSASASSSTTNAASSSSPSAGSSSSSSRAICPTLFVTNLSMLTTEQDLAQLFQTTAGFHRLRFQLNTEGLPICFVDFDSEVNSSAARDHFQSFVVHQSPLRIEFAKQKMKRIRKR